MDIKIINISQKKLITMPFPSHVKDNSIVMITLAILACLRAPFARFF